MPLSEYEQRVLDQMERQLTSDDPKLVSTFRGRGQTSVRRYLLAGAGALGGLVVLVVGAATGQPLIGVLGFVAMFTSAVLAFSSPRRRGPRGVVAKDGSVSARPAGAKRPKPSRPSSGFLDRLEERWERRRRGDL